MILGLFIYLGYGMKHSKESKNFKFYQRIEDEENELMVKEKNDDVDDDDGELEENLKK